MIRWRLGDAFGHSWARDIRDTPAHYVRQLINDIERSKNHFRGLSKGDAKRYSVAAKEAGIPVD